MLFEALIFEMSCILFNREGTSCRPLHWLAERRYLEKKRPVGV